MKETVGTDTIIYEEELDLILESKFEKDENIETVNKYFQRKINAIFATHVSKDSIDKHSCKSKRGTIYIHIPICAPMDVIMKIGNEIKGRCSAKITNFVIKKLKTEKI